MMTQELWNARDDLQKQWEDFLNTDAGRKGLEMLEQSRLPYSTNEEPPTVKIARLDRMSGFHECIRMLRGLSKPGAKKEHRTPQEWAHVAE